MSAVERPHGRSRYWHQGCRCAVCTEDVRLYVAARRAAKRGLTPARLGKGATRGPGRSPKRATTRPRTFPNS